eukprot:TRINITY_DN12109_c0_g1_i1.p1 TRINITY_DN12109_c0_g1~~TRINITY_DN12109_c0_g1_i1.p1  ORF type:complete len:421 (+),score=159.94 TRINITY_DN12109_c0_g1_i1:183-1445(+)
MKSLFGRGKKKQQREPSPAPVAQNDDDDDWELLDEEGECTNYSPSPAALPYAGLFTMEDRKVTRSDFEALRILGKGATAVVLLVRYKRDPSQLYALKVIKKKDIVTSGRPGDVVRERNIMKSARACKFLVKMHYCFQSATKLFFVLDYMPGGDLYVYSGEWDGGHCDEATAKYYAASVFSALSFLHEQGVVYRDLKPENVLLDSMGNAKLADFGLSKQLATQNQPSESESLDERAQSFVGTAYYIAPEILKQKAYSFSVDWWSFGVLVFNLMTGENPFYGENIRSIFHSILNREFKVRDEYRVSDQAKDLIARLLTKDEKQRIQGDAIKNHPWFAGFDWDSLGTKTAPHWRPPHDMVTVQNAANIQGKSMGGDGDDSYVRISEVQQKMFENFTLDNSSVMPDAGPVQDSSPPLSSNHYMH